MQKTNERCRGLLFEFTEGYMEKLFYFCLKKTGSYTEAEDLTQEIALQIITALNRGTIPESFPAWVWKIARNRYSRWAAKKHKRPDAVTGNCLDEDEIADESEDIIDEMIHEEQMALLRRELAFIKSDYRSIIVAYYLENQSVRDIASSLSLSETAVKQRLFRARQILKEGMDMAREFGRLSYKPENIAFIMNGNPGSGNEPWNYISRSLCKNILLAAYRTPATAEELAMEVGVALPYMEEELTSLTEATLMKKNGSKYETNFFIVSAEAQDKITEHLLQITPAFTQAVIDAVEFITDWNNRNHPQWHDGHQSFEEMKWALLMTETDNICFRAQTPSANSPDSNPNLGPWGHTLRPNGGEWDILGMEMTHGNCPEFVGLSGCVSTPNEKDLPEIFFRQYHFKCHGLDKRIPPCLTYAEGQGLVSVARGKWDEVNEVLLNRLESIGYIKKTDHGYLPAIMVIQSHKLGQKPSEVQEKYDALLQKACDLAAQHYRFCCEQIQKEIPDFLKEDTFQIDHAAAGIFTMRGAVVEEALKQGYLTFDEKNDRQMLGAFLRL